MLGKIQDWRQTNFMPFCKGEVRSQRVSQFDGNIVKYTKQIVEQQVYKHLKDVKVIKNKTKKKTENNRTAEKAWKQMFIIMKDPYLYFILFFSCKGSE